MELHRWEEQSSAGMASQLPSTLRPLRNIRHHYSSSPSFCKFNCILCGWVFCLYVCMCTMCVPGAHRGQQRTSDPPGLELQIVVSRHVGAGSSAIATVFLVIEPSLHPCFHALLHLMQFVANWTVKYEVIKTDCSNCDRVNSRVRTKSLLNTQKATCEVTTGNTSWG